MTDGYLCGWRVRSELDLPELAPWTGPDIAPDLVFRFGETPSQLDDVVERTPFVQVGRDGTCLLTHPGVATYHMTGPDEVVMSSNPDASEAEIRLFLLGSVLGYLCHRRGLFPFHASCVSINGRAVAFSGPSGAGKSTTAVSLAKRGHPLLADDITAIDASGPGAPIMYPAFPRLKLWQDSLDSAGIGSEGLERNRPGMSKFHYRHHEEFAAAATPLAAIFMLQKAGPGLDEQITRLERPVEIISTISSEVFRPRVGKAMGRRPALLAAQAKIASTVPVYRLVRPFDLKAMDGWLEQVEAIVGG